MKICPLVFKISLPRGCGEIPKNDLHVFYTVWGLLGTPKMLMATGYPPGSVESLNPPSQSGLPFVTSCGCETENTTKL